MLRISKGLFIIACLVVGGFLVLAFLSGMHALPAR
jgi:hypothetical protein